MSLQDWQDISPEQSLDRSARVKAFQMTINSDPHAVQMVTVDDLTRKSVLISNLGLGTVYLGEGDFITPTSQSFPLQSGEAIVIDHTTAAIYAISASGANVIYVLVE
jgi:hypothetical protein